MRRSVVARPGLPAPIGPYSQAVRAGSRLDLVASTTFLLGDMGDFAELNELFAEHFAGEPPARMVVQVPLPRGLRISIGCVAAVEG